MLARFLKNGNGVEKDLKEAVRLYSLAAEQGQLKAIRALRDFGLFAETKQAEIAPPRYSKYCAIS